MDSRELAQHTSDVLNKLMTGSSGVSLSPEMFERISSLNRADTRKEWRRSLFTAKDGDGFRVPLGASSMPYITKITRNGVQLATTEPKQFKLTDKTESGSSDMRGTRLTDFKGAIEHVNRVSFRDGINFDAFKVLNIGRDPVNRDQVNFLLNRGSILPLSKDSGLYIPDYAMSGNYFSFEYEGRFKNVTSVNFDNVVGKPVKNTFGFDITAMFPYDVTDSPSYKAYVDGTIEHRTGRTQAEAVLGTGPMSNMLYAAHLTMEAWKARDMIHPTDFVMDDSSGLHISTNMYARDNMDHRNISTFLNHEGLIFAALGRTGERWKSSNTYLGPQRTYNSRNDFRLVNDRLEARYPGPVLDIGYLANQMTLVGKLSNDLQLYIKQYKSSPDPSYNMSASSWSSSARNRAHITNDLHSEGNTANSRMMKQWFNAFTDAIGITDEFDKALLLKFNQACLNTEAPREGSSV